MKTSTVVILIATIVTLGIIIGGMVWATDNSGERIAQTGVMVLIVLLGMLKSDFDKAEIKKDVKENTAITVEAKETVKIIEADRKASNAKRDGTLQEIKDVVMSVEKQTNGMMEKRFDSLEKKIDDKASHIVEQVVKKTGDSHHG